MPEGHPALLRDVKSQVWGFFFNLSLDIGSKYKMQHAHKKANPGTTELQHFSAVAKSANFQPLVFLSPLATGS